MFELKSYQQGALDTLTSFFQRCRMDGDIDTAFQQTLQDNNFVETPYRAYSFADTPYVCICSGQLI